MTEWLRRDQDLKIGDRLQITYFEPETTHGDEKELSAEFTARGAAIVRGLCDQSYGCRDFEIDDLNGYRLCFGHDLESR